MSLLERTQELLTRRTDKEKIGLREISDASDGDVEYWWLKKFAAKKIPDPSVNRVQRLHDILKTLKKRSS